MSEIPNRITEDQYDKLMRKMWELEQRQAGIDKTVYTIVQVDELFARLLMIETKLANNSIPQKAESVSQPPQL